MDLNDIKAVIHKYDMEYRKKVIYCNPLYEEELRDNFGYCCKIISSDLIEPNKVYIMDRKDIEF